MYGNFAGRDASRGMAKQSFDLGAFFSLGLFIWGLITRWIIVDMLTPVDQPLDKLEDLKPEEMCVYFILSLGYRLIDVPFWSDSDNMKGEQTLQRYTMSIRC
jgi:hypothetical protein